MSPNLPSRSNKISKKTKLEKSVKKQLVEFRKYIEKNCEDVGDNFKAAFAGETHEYTDMYPGMAKTARDEGFDEIADWFETLAKAERSHANRFQKALDSM